MKKVLMFFALIVFGLSAFAQMNNYQDVVYLKNGSVIKGVIIEQIPNVSLKIQTNDGNIFVYQMTEVEKMTKEQVMNQKNNPKYNPNIKVKTNADSYRNPVNAWLWSFLVPGIGQFYNGQTSKGLSHLLWYLGSSTLMIVGLNNMTITKKIYYGGWYDINGNYRYDYFIKRRKTSVPWLVVGLVGSASSLVCWIVSQVDASRTAHNINEANNYMSFKLSDKTNLSFMPEVKPVVMPTYGVTPSYGFGMKLSF